MVRTIADLESETSYFPEDTEVFIEIRGVVHQIHDVYDSSQGVFLVVTQIKKKGICDEQRRILPSLLFTRP